MSLFDNIKDGYQKQQGKIQEARDKAPVKLKAEYYGGYNKYKKADGTLYIYPDKVQFTTIGLKSFTFSIEKQNLTEVAVEGKDEAGRRITVTRLLATGILAFGWRKKTSQQDTFITAVTTDGQEAVFHVEDKSHMELKPVITQKIALPKTSNAPTQSHLTGSVADELTKLASLKQQGTITQAEFEKKKAQLLDHS